MSDEPDAIHYAAMQLIAWADARANRPARSWEYVRYHEQQAALEFVRAMKQASIKP